MTTTHARTEVAVRKRETATSVIVETDSQGTTVKHVSLNTYNAEVFFCVKHGD